MNGYNRIAWNEGMFLGPHHFQQWDRFTSASRWYDQDTRQPHAWGVRKLSFDAEALENRRLVPTRLEAVLPDGTVVRAPTVDPLPPGRQLDDHFTADLERLEVHLALPECRSGVPVCRPAGQQATVESPYRTEAVEVDDQNNPGKTLEVMVARQNLRLLLSGENLDGHVTLKLAEIVRGPDAKVLLAMDFAPAALSLEAAGQAELQLRSVLEALTAKSSALSEQTRQRGGGMVEFGSGDVGNFWLLHTVNSFIPLLADLQRTPGTHPLVLYRQLAQLAGALCTFGVDRHPRDIPAYSHENLGDTLGGLERMIRELLETVMPSRFTNLPLVQRDETMLVGECADARVLDGDLHWYLSVTGDMAEARIRDEAPSQIIIGTPHNIDFLVRTATPGITLVHTAVPPRDFPLKAGHTYFKLEADEETWETLRESRAIAVYLGGHELRTCTYQLIAMN